VKVYQGFEAIGEISNPVLTIGTFDGVHLGHQKIIQRLNKEAEKTGGESVLFTFYPHPRTVIDPDNHGLKLIQTQEEKIEKLRRMGLQHLIIYPFTPEFADLSAREFVCEYLVKQLKVKTIVVGYDHQFGKNREGSLAFLQELSRQYPFEVIEIPAHEIDEVNVSSTKIRQALELGDIETANRFLNEPFELNGTVIHGNALGRTIGFPTANLDLADDLKSVPAKGVYAVQVKLPDGRLFKAMMNIGVRPTVSNVPKIHLEVFLFDFSEDLYDQRITVYLLKRVREEKRFESIDALRAQLQDDEKNIRAMLGHLVG
jgi:riboflavin kinase/FMN adenylyltransferase